MSLKEYESLNENNVKEFIEKVIQKYEEKGMLVDYLFWKRAIKLLEEKNENEKSKVEELKKEIKEEGVDING